MKHIFNKRVEKEKCFEKCVDNLLKRFTKSVARSAFTSVLQQCAKKWVTLLRSMLKKVYMLAAKKFVAASV